MLPSRESVASGPGCNISDGTVDIGRDDESRELFAQLVLGKPDNPYLYFQQGYALRLQEKYVEAEAACRKAVELKPDYKEAYNNLGIALRHQRKYAEAEVAYRKAIALNQGDAVSYCNLGDVLQRQGRFRESLEAYRRCLTLDSKEDVMRTRAYLCNVRTAERLVELEKHLPAVLHGDTPPANPADAVTLAQMCLHKKQHVAAARLYTDAFADEPRLAENLGEHRYSTACAAALAGCGKGEDAGHLSDKESASLRKQGRIGCRPT